MCSSKQFQPRSSIFRSTFYTQPKQDRQMTLLHEYSFRCDCLACSSNFPLFYDLKLFDKKIHKIANKGKQELSKLDANQAKKRFREYCDIIQRHHAKAFPSLEIIILQECLLQCMSLIIKPKLLLAWSNFDILMLSFTVEILAVFIKTTVKLYFIEVFSKSKAWQIKQNQNDEGFCFFSIFKKHLTNSIK